MKIGVFGGSFNPVHSGHLRLAEAAFSELNLDRIYFVPAFRNPLSQKEECLPASLRLKLLRAALAGRASFKVSLCELRRKGLSFTVDTLHYFRKKFGSRAVLYFLAGEDSAASLSKWKRPDEVLRLCRFVAATRPGASRRRLDPRILRLPFNALTVSSSEVRRRARERRGLRGWVPRGTERPLIDFYARERAHPRDHAV